MIITAAQLVGRFTERFGYLVPHPMGDDGPPLYVLRVSEAQRASGLLYFDESDLRRWVFDEFKAVPSRVVMRNVYLTLVALARPETDEEKPKPPTQPETPEPEPTKRTRTRRQRG